MVSLGRFYVGLLKRRFKKSDVAKSTTLFSKIYFKHPIKKCNGLIFSNLYQTAFFTHQGIFSAIPLNFIP